jgi:hypothetical protein
VVGINAKLVGAIRRSDGSIQLTLAGSPLYRYVGDRRAGDRTGQARGGIWWLVQANGARNKTCPPTGSTRQLTPGIASVSGSR